MKKVLFLASLLALAALPAGSAQAADTTVTLSSVHLCCNSCVKGVDTALKDVTGVTAKSDKDAGTVVLTAPDKSTAQKAVNALVAAGYFGVSSDAGIKVVAESGARDAVVESMKVDGVHLCCAKCVTAVNDVVTKVPGVKAHTATKNAESFQVTGSFNAKEVFAGLNRAGLGGKMGK